MKRSPAAGRMMVDGSDCSWELRYGQLWAVLFESAECKALTRLYATASSDSDTGILSIESLFFGLSKMSIGDTVRGLGGCRLERSIFEHQPWQDGPTNLCRHRCLLQRVRPQKTIVK